MNIEEIEKFLHKDKSVAEQCIKINFKKRDSIYGIFIQTNDYNDLKSKNFWRIVTKTHFEQWNKTKDVNLAKIFNGSEFSRLVLLKEAFEE
jgi:hypothetical protein